MKIQLLATVRGMLAGRINVVDGCDCITTLALKVDSPWGDKLRLFEGVASECDEFPRGSVRQEWEPDALEQRDLEVARYTASIRDPVLSACRELEMLLKAELLGSSSHT